MELSKCQKQKDAIKKWRENNKERYREKSKLRAKNRIPGKNSQNYSLIFY